MQCVLSGLRCRDSSAIIGIGARKAPNPDLSGWKNKEIINEKGHEKRDEHGSEAQ